MFRCEQARTVYNNAMVLLYLHLAPDQTPPQLLHEPFRVIIVSEAEVTQEWCKRVTEWLLKSGCLYVVAWGTECEKWHDTVDWLNVEEFDGNIPEDRFVMTTWHTDEPLSEAMWFAGQCAYHSTVELSNTLVLHIASQAREADLLETYAASQIIHDDH